MEHKVVFKTDEKIFQLLLLYSVVITSSVENLVDTAEILLPETVFNKPLNIQDKIKRGTAVQVDLGYSNDLRSEFTGYVTDIRAVDGTLKIFCEDALFLFRTDIQNEQLKPTSISKIAQRLIDQVDPSFSLDCDYDIGYESFVIHQATAYDVLKKLAEETKANIYFDTAGKVLHIHPPYKIKTGSVVYSMDRNIEKSSLEYKLAIDRKAEITVESIDQNGNVQTLTVGSTGGEKITIKVPGLSPDDMQKVADVELQKRVADKYEGTFDTWLVPYCAPGYSAKIKDPDYPDQESNYFVSKVTTEFSSGGGKRTISPTLKL